MAAGFTYPLMLNMAGKDCLIVGGGPVAARKLQGLCQAGAQVRVVAPAFCPALLAAAQAWPGQCRLLQQAYEPGLAQGAFLLVAATDDGELNRAISSQAPCLCNNVSQPQEGNCVVPACWQQGSLQLAVASGGMAAYSRLLRDYLGEQLGPGFAELAQFLLEERRRLRLLEPSSSRRQAFWRRLLNRQLLDLVAAGAVEQAKEKIRDEVNRYRVEP